MPRVGIRPGCDPPRDWLLAGVVLIPSLQRGGPVLWGQSSYFGAQRGFLPISDVFAISGAVFGAPGQPRTPPFLIASVCTLQINCSRGINGLWMPPQFPSSHQFAPTVAGFAAMFAVCLGPAAWVLAHLEDYKKREE
uniref:Uncharacterized protein n=1 Tax=Anas platyrhynchos platyrhynchos TaxID=8840 RepID=A0A493TF61_ANAPP